MLECNTSSMNLLKFTFLELIEQNPFCLQMYCIVIAKGLSKRTTDLKILNGSLRSFKRGEKLYVGNTRNSLCMQ